MMNFTLSNQVQIPAVGIGTFMMTPDQAEQAVVDALACGYRMIDTAQAYYNEEGVGAAISNSGIPREELFLTTKVWITNAGYEKAKASIEESLKKLKTDYISHFPNFQLSPGGPPPTLQVPPVAYYFPCGVHAALFLV